MSALYTLTLNLQGSQALPEEIKTRLADYIEVVGQTLNPMWGFRPDDQAETAVLVFLGELLSWLAAGAAPVFSTRSDSEDAYSGTETWTIEAGPPQIKRIDKSCINDSWQSMNHTIHVECAGFPDRLALGWNGGYYADSPLSNPTVTISGITASLSQKITALAQQMFKECSLMLKQLP